MNFYAFIVIGMLAVGVAGWFIVAELKRQIMDEEKLLREFGVSRAHVRYVAEEIGKIPVRGYRPLYHAPRHDRGSIYDDLSLTRFEKKDNDNG